MPILMDYFVKNRRMCQINYPSGANFHRYLWVSRDMVGRCCGNLCHQLFMQCLNGENPTFASGLERDISAKSTFSSSEEHQISIIHNFAHVVTQPATGARGLLKVARDRSKQVISSNSLLVFRTILWFECKKRGATTGMTNLKKKVTKSPMAGIIHQLKKHFHGIWTEVG